VQFQHSPSCSENPQLHGPGAATQDVRDLGVAKALGIQQHAGALMVRQLVEKLAHLGSVGNAVGEIPPDGSIVVGRPALASRKAESGIAAVAT
jgi:hypothetical protein